MTIKNEEAVLVYMYIDVSLFPHITCCILMHKCLGFPFVSTATVLERCDIQATYR